MNRKICISTVLISLSLVLSGCGIIPANTDDEAVPDAVESKKSEPAYFCFVCGNPATRAVRNAYSGETEQYCVEDYKNIFGTASTKAKEKEHSGLENVLASAKQCSQIRFTPVADLPSQFGDFPANKEITGLPYSSARANDKMIGNQVSVHTFLSAVQNPRSVLYTRRLTTPNAETYYGIVCSDFVDYCYKIGPLFTCADFRDWGKLTEISYDEIQVGDVLNSGEHIILITELERDETGAISSITRTEGKKPVVTSTKTSWETFYKGYANRNYKVYRYKDIDGVGYEQLPYVCGYEDESIQENISFPDIMSEFGDKAALMTGESTVVNVINPKDYTSICVKRNGTAIQNINAAEGGTLGDFTLNKLQPGMYELSITNGKDSSSSTFFVADADCRYDAEQKKVYFSSKNAKPIAVYVYDDRPTNKAIELTAEDIENGCCDLSAYIDDDYKYVKVGFKCYYGVATWYSHDLHQWKHVP